MPWSCRESNPGPEKVLNDTFYMLRNNWFLSKKRLASSLQFALVHTIIRRLVNIALGYLGVVEQFLINGSQNQAIGNRWFAQSD